MKQLSSTISIILLAASAVSMADGESSSKSLGENTERLFDKKPITRASFCAAIEPCVEAVAVDKKVTVRNAIDPIRFNTAKSSIKQKHLKALKTLIDKLGDQRSLTITFVGHTDNQPLGKSITPIYGDNQGLSESRANNVMAYVKKAMPDARVNFEHRGYGSTQPMADNTTRQGRTLNRRVEVIAEYLQSETPTAGLNTCPAGSGAHSASAVLPKAEANSSLIANNQLTPWRVSIDGKPTQTINSPHTADIQRCNDVALEKSKIQIQYDNLRVEPMLNVAAWPVVVAPGDEVAFRAWTNYPYWIESGEVLFYQKNAVGGEVFINSIPLNNDYNAQWVVPDNLKDTTQIFYKLRVYDKEGHIDETALLDLKFDSRAKPKVLDPAQTEQELLAGFGQNALAKRSIPVVGGTVTVNGIDIPADKTVWLMDQPVPVDASGRFVSEHILPTGFHTVEVSVMDDQGRKESFWRDIQFKNNDWFYVGIADLTIARQNTSGDIDLVRGEDYDSDSLSSYGRFAFYAKGKVKDKYKVTARVDSGEEPVEKIFKRLHRKDPRALLKRLDSEDTYPTFGDDSVTVEDTPTQGKIYVKVEDERSHALWGNFKADNRRNELLSLNRGLYGAQLDYNSRGIASGGESRTQVELFAADPGTIPAHEEFLGTGGSLYYLRHRDVTLGSEQLRVEVRDKDSNFVIASQRLSAGQDYDLDELQGTLLLSKPLQTFANNALTGLVRSASYAGNPVYLIVDYEYVPGFSDVDSLAVGGSVSHWFNDHVRFGVTASKQDLSNGDQEIGAIDLTLRKTDNTWVKLSAARSEGAGVLEQRSFDGGFDFNPATQSQVSDEADAGRVELSVNGEDIGLNKTLQTTAYWQEREAGYGALGLQTNVDTRQAGINLFTPITKNTDVLIKYDEQDRENVDLRRAGEVDLSYRISERWSVSGGVREDERVTIIDDLGRRTDGILRLDYLSNKRWGVYGFAQNTLAKNDKRLDNDRYGVGGFVQLTERVSVNGEVSDGDFGVGALAGLSYQASERTNYYINYGLDADEQDEGILERQGTLITGAKTRYNDSLSFYAEEKYTHGNQPKGLTQAYGVELAFDDKWTYGASLEVGELESEDVGTLERRAVGFQVGYRSDKVNYGGALEFRNDKTDTDDRDSWLLRNNYGYRYTEEKRLLGRLDLAYSESDNGEFFDGNFAELVLGYAYRPIDNTRWNSLLTYSYFYDKTSPDQVTGNDLSVDYQQRSHVFAIDLNYDITKRWEIGGKYAFRRSELRNRDELDNGWFRSDAALYVLRADWHLTHRWDFHIEGRSLEIKAAEDRKAGILVGLYRHLGDNFKLGVGYNFTDFSDDLTDLDYDAEGTFINAVGKF